MSGITYRRIDGAQAAKAGPEEMHLALFYGDDREYLDGVMRFLEPALAAGEPVAVAVPPRRGELLRERLGGASDQVQILDMFELGRNPARIIPAVERLLARYDGALLHYVGEPIWPGRSREEVREATKHEALINLAWPGAKIRVLCLYDAARLDQAVLADAERTHPRVIRGREEYQSGAYVGPAVPAGCDQPLVAPPREALSRAFGLEDLFAIRALIGEHAAAAGLSQDRVGDLVFAVNELATNAIRHGSGGGTLHLWTRSARLVCQVSNRGRIDDPLAGRRVPTDKVAGGLGLWTVNQLCDLVEVRTSDAGTTVRVHTTLN
jgi:anti-sigma regulatory factor (Ser/Thr protein kinase)